MSLSWQRHVTPATGYLKLGMFDDAALALGEIEPEDKARKEVLAALADLCVAAQKWDMAATVAARLVKIEPEKDDTAISGVFACQVTVHLSALIREGGNPMANCWIAG
jgi:lipopolysaccharide biosynthesis regulator YciM